jgi:hypothetical protein
MINQQTISEALASQFHGNVRLKVKRPNIYQVFAPFYHEDGDMIDIFVEPADCGIRYCDHGMTLMRLSYSFDLDTDNKQRIFKELLAENQVEFDEPKGNIYFDTTLENACGGFLHFAQVVGKVSRLDVLRREVVSGLFFEMVDEFIRNELQEFQPQLRASPLPDRDDLEVTAAFNIHPHPVYLMAVRNSGQARLAGLSFLEFQRANLPFKGYVVHDDFEALPAKDRKRITSAADKQFPSFEDFRENAKKVLLREAA